MAATSYSLKGKRVLVTGASSGIGASVARCFAEAGATVGICARRKERLDVVLADCRAHSPGSARWVVDLADLSRIEAFARQVEAELGGVDVLVNNAGIPKRRHVRDLRLDEVDDVMAINYQSPAFTECMAVDLAGTGVSVHMVFPGVIDTDLFHLPDNEESLSDLEALPASGMAEAILRQVETGELELYFPSWFADIARAKAADVPGFLAGTTEWVRQREAQLGGRLT